jgi:uncharacterized protein (TIGR00251 family)
MTEVLIPVRLSPRASRDELGVVRGGVLTVRVTAPPVDGRANKALCRLIAGRAGVAPARVRIVRGAGSRDKLVGIEASDPKRVVALFGTDPTTSA